jgi:hypothetical protein
MGFAVRYELGIWRSLGTWLLQLRTVPAGGRAHPYAGPITPLMTAFIVVSALELPILHLLLPWAMVRLIVDVLSAGGLLWMIGLLAAVRVHPHVVTDEGIRVRYSFSVDVTVPWSAVVSVRSRVRMLDRKGTVQCEQTATGAVLSIAMARQTTVDIVLTNLTALHLPDTGDEPVVELRIYADDPAALVADYRARIGSGAAGPDRDPVR